MENKSLQLEDVEFSEASPQQREAAWRLNAISWRGPLSVEEYLGRESHLANQQLTKDNGIRFWVVSLKTNPVEIVASCETMQKTVLAADIKDGFRVLTGYSIASVYTNPAYRRMGMASFLISSLRSWFDDKGSADLSVLYSDIGPKYYSTLGWTVFPARQVSLEIQKAGVGKALPNNADFLSDKSTIRNLCDTDVKEVYKQLGIGLEGQTLHIAFSPSWEQVFWHIARAEYVGKIMRQKVPERFGAITKSKQCWTYWYQDFRSGELMIQRIVFPQTEDKENLLLEVKVLLVAAVAEAEAWNLTKVVLWNPGQPEIMEAASQLEKERLGSLKLSVHDSITTSIPSLRLRNGRDTKDVVWLHNEYYGWC